MKLSKDFAYAVARLHSIENKMLNNETQDRMCEAGSLDDVFKMLYEYGYESAEIEHNDYTDMFDMEIKKTLDLIEKIAPASTYFSVFRLKNDYHNLKVLMKAQRLESDYSKLLEDNGNYSTQELKDIIREKEYDKLSLHMQNALLMISEDFAKTSDPQIIDILFDEAYYAQCFEISRKLENKFLEDSIKMSVDTKNILTFFRIKRLELSLEFLKKVLIDGAEISVSSYVEAFDKNEDEAVRELKNKKYEHLIKLGYEELSSGTPLIQLEKEIDDLAISSLKKYRYMAFGIEPVIAHLMAKESEIKNIRMILSDITNGLAPDEIKERLRVSYA